MQPDVYWMKDSNNDFLVLETWNNWKNWTGMDAGAVTAMGGIWIGIGKPGMLWGWLVGTKLQQKTCQHPGKPNLQLQWKIWWEIMTELLFKNALQHLNFNLRLVALALTEKVFHPNRFV